MTKTNSEMVQAAREAFKPGFGSQPVDVERFFANWLAREGQPNGVASVGSDGFIPAGQLPVLTPGVAEDLLQIYGRISPEFFGAVGDNLESGGLGGTDDLAALQDTFDYYADGTDRQQGGRVDLSRGYVVSDGLVAELALNLVGGGWGIRTKKNSGSYIFGLAGVSGKTLLKISSAVGTSLRHFRLAALPDSPAAVLLEYTGVNGEIGHQTDGLWLGSYSGNEIGFDGYPTVDGIKHSGDVGNDSHTHTHLRIRGGTGFGVNIDNQNASNHHYNGLFISFYAGGVRVKGAGSLYTNTLFTHITSAPNFTLVGAAKLDIRGHDGERVWQLAKWDAAADTTTFRIAHGGFQIDDDYFTSDNRLIDTSTSNKFNITIENFLMSFLGNYTETFKLKIGRTDGGASTGRIRMIDTRGFYPLNFDFHTSVGWNDQGFSVVYEPAIEAAQNVAPMDRVMLNYARSEDRSYQAFRFDISGKANVYAGPLLVKNLTTPSSANFGVAVATGSGATTISYRLSLLTRDGETAASAAATVTNGSPDASHTNQLTIYWQHGAYGCKIYRQIGGTGSETLLTTVEWGSAGFGNTLHWTDDGSVTPAGGAFPTVNTTGNASVDGTLTLTQASGASGYQHPLILGTYRLWVASDGKLYKKNGAPTSDQDGTIVGTES